MTAGAAADEVDPLLRLPATVRHVESGGSWAGPQGAGFYRAIVLEGGVDAIVDELVVQWVSESGREPVVASVKPHEISDAGLTKMRVAWVRHHGAPVGLVVEARHRITGKPFNIRLGFGSPGTYRVESSSITWSRRKSPQAPTTTRPSASPADR